MKVGITRLALLPSAVLAMGLLGGCATTSQQSATPVSTRNTAQQRAGQAIAAAKSAYADVVTKGFAWTTTPPLIGKAEKAYQAGNYAQASALAHKAQAQAEGGINQYYLALGTRNLDKLNGMQDAMSSSELAQLDQAEKLYRDAKGKPLYDLTEQMLTEMAHAKHMHFTVSRGNTLWGIAALPLVYGNPYEWPLIYKANAGQIHDPDLIFPGENLIINQAASQSAINMAIAHARHRGAWKLGQPTSSDLQYLKGGQ